MQLSKREEQILNTILNPYRSHDTVQRMKQYIQHGSISTYDHCEDVCRMCFWINRHFCLGADEHILVIGAFLHDFYLYDWHEKDASHRLHGFFHPDKACRNAIKIFQINDRIQRVIRCHMWPLTVTRIPTSREALIVCLVDKYCSTIETLLKR